MAKGLIWATAEDLARNRGHVISLYRQILRSLNSPNLPLNLAARLAKKAEVRAIFMLASEERSLHNINDVINTAEYALSILRKGEIPNSIQCTIGSYHSLAPLIYHAFGAHLLLVSPRSYIVILSPPTTPHSSKSINVEKYT
ncbi:hypothetical protein GH714_021448 [Hevea brasiliensis]|uniref:LYR motif containing domain-containing protein n=1 Tax=Hevea brasiliensis TaxID=3981 RepID=A0A6A6MXR6_HEVBR|nr:hypothetical protein GH714_021448 [Hevea brasiliensis]